MKDFHGVWTPLVISIAMVLLGSLMAFDIGGYASKSAEYNTGFTPWGSSGNRLYVNPRIIGWLFLVVGVVMLLVSVIILIMRLAA